MLTENEKNKKDNNLQNQILSKRSDNSGKSKLSQTCISNISQ